MMVVVVVVVVVVMVGWRREEMMAVCRPNGWAPVCLQTAPSVFLSGLERPPQVLGLLRRTGLR